MGQRASEGSEQGRDTTVLAVVTAVGWSRASVETGCKDWGSVTCSRKLNPRRRWPALQTKQVEVRRPSRGVQRNQKGITRVAWPPRKMRRSNGTAKPERVRLWGGRCEPWAPGHRHRLPDHPHPGAGDGESQATALLGDPSWGNGAPTQGAGWGASCVPIPCLVQCSWGLKGLPGTQRARWWRGERLACPQVLISPLPPLPPALQSWAERAPLQGDAPLPRHPTAEGGTVGPRGVVSVWSVDALALGRVEKRGSCCARACMCVCVCACACVCGCRGGGGRPEAHGCFLFWLSSSTPLSVQEGITVYFHAIIPKDCNVNLNSHQVYVRGGEEFGKLKWQNNVCEMHYTK